MTSWDPYQVLWLPHDPDLTGWQVLRGYVRRMNWMYRTTPDRERWSRQASRIGRACWVLRTRACRRGILADLAVQPGWLRSYAHPDVTVMADAQLTPVRGGHTLEEACDMRALEREAAALRLERAATRQRRRRFPRKSIFRKLSLKPRGRSGVKGLGRRPIR
jgi:hypothetical protein